jgi:hypothetical protein
MALRIDSPQNPGLTTLTLVLSYLVTCFRNQVTRVLLVAALRSTLILGTIRKLQSYAEDVGDMWRGSILDMCVTRQRRVGKKPMRPPLASTSF